MLVTELIRLPDPRQDVRIEMREVLKDVRGRPHVFVRVRLTGWHFPHRAPEAFAVIGNVVSNHVVISRDAFYDEVVTNFHVKKLARFKLHAKCVVVDGTFFFVGSQNLRKVSMDRRREVGIIVEDPAMARRIERVFDEDWTNATEMAAVMEANAT